MKLWITKISVVISWQTMLCCYCQNVVICHMSEVPLTMSPCVKDPFSYFSFVFHSIAWRESLMWGTSDTPAASLLWSSCVCGEQFQSSGVRDLISSPSIEVCQVSLWAALFWEFSNETTAQERVDCSAKTWKYLKKLTDIEMLCIYLI